MMESQTSSSGVAFATPAGFQLPASGLGARVRAIAPTTGPIWGEFCLHLGRTTSLPQALIAQTSARRSNVGVTDFMANAYFVKARDGSYAFGGTG